MSTKKSAYVLIGIFVESIDFFTLLISENVLIQNLLLVSTSCGHKIVGLKSFHHVTCTSMPIFF